jgi:hypothetical protein
VLQQVFNSFYPFLTPMIDKQQRLLPSGRVWHGHESLQSCG